MTTENQTPDADDEVPPVARFYGLAVSEWVTYSFVVVSVIAVLFGSVVGDERDAEAERAMATLAALTEEAENRASAGEPLVCNNTLLEPSLLENEYLDLSIKPAPFNEKDKALGYGPALYVSVVEKEVSGDTWDTAKRLMNLVKKEASEEAEESEETTRREVADNIELENTAEDEDEKPKNRLREVRKKGFGEDEDYLRYYILASEVAVCDGSV